MYNLDKPYGVTRFNDPDMFKYLRYYFEVIPKIKYDGVLYPIIGRKLILWQTQRLLAKKYLQGWKYTKGESSAWVGIDSFTENWHTDMDEGNNTAFLLYMTDMDESTGGGLSLKHNKRDDYITIWPKKYDVVIMDQYEQYLHRVEPVIKPIRRYVCNVEFNLVGIL